MEHETFAQRLRGKRFWIPLLALLLAGSGAFYVLTREAGPSVAGATAQPADLGPPLQGLVRKLELNGFICADLLPTAPDRATCVINQDAAPTSLATFASRNELTTWMSDVVVSSKQQLTATGTVGYAITGKRWALAGIWSVIGGYQDTKSADAQTAQDLNSLLKGCLELLPKEAGSCGP